MKEALKSLAGFAILAAVFLGCIALAVLFIKGGVWLGEILLPSLYLGSILVFVLCLLFLVPLAVFHSTRGWAGLGLFTASYLFGASTWLTGLLLTYNLWGTVAVVIGLFFFGVGVVPLGLLATLFNGLWAPFIALLLMAVVTYGFRYMGSYAIEKYDEERAAALPPPIDWT